MNSTSIITPTRRGGITKAIPIKSITLDDYFAAGNRVNNKMDIEIQLHALRDAKRVLQRLIKLATGFLTVWPEKQAGNPRTNPCILEDKSFSLFLLGANGRVQFDRSYAGALESIKYFNLFAEREPATRA